MGRPPGRPMSAAAAASGGCSFSLSQSFNGLSSAAGGAGYLAYGPSTALVGGWSTTASPLTVSVDAVTYGAFGTTPFTNTAAPSPPVFIDLAGTPGPGGITTSLAIPCAGSFTVQFESLVISAGPVIASATGTGVVSPGLVVGPSGFQTNSLVFTAPGATNVTLTLETPDATSGNVFVGNITVS